MLTIGHTYDDTQRLQLLIFHEDLNQKHTIDIYDLQLVNCQ